MSVVTLVTSFPTVTKPRERHAGPGRTVRPRRVGRAEMRAFIEETLDDVERTECHFQFCPGPDKPTAAMRTCMVCFRIKRLRVMLGWLADEPA